MTGHTPYGYRIENGVAVIHEEEAKRIRELYEYYLSGLGLEESAAKVGIMLKHSGVRRILENKHYLGDAFYPRIIDKEIFDKAADEIYKRASSMGRLNINVDRKAKTAKTSFHMKRTPKQRYKDPFRQAEYVYSLIESED